MGTNAGTYLSHNTYGWLLLLLMLLLLLLLMLLLLCCFVSICVIEFCFWASTG